MQINNESYFKFKCIFTLIIFKLYFLYCNGIVLNNTYFRLLEIRFSTKNHLGKSELEGHVD